jgi:hypothetical protein
MNQWCSRDVRGSWQRVWSGLVLSTFLLAVVLIDCHPAAALPAFARKYGMPCSACHEAWPMLSPFGQQFKDNGYQMGNDRDAPIFQQAAYWPVTFRITPTWHRESSNGVAVDGSSGGTVVPVETKVGTQGFDWSGLDFHTAGTLANNYSFYVLPSSDNKGAFHFESVWARFDNLLGSSWLNVKVGKFELDNLLSEKRILTLSNTGGFYQNYHFQPLSQPGVAESAYTFGIGNNQVGVEWMGHSKDDRTRVSASFLSSNNGSPSLPTSRSYDAYFAASRAFQVGNLGLQRVGAFVYLGQAPTYYQYTSGGAPVPGTGIGNQPYQRFGLIGMWYLRKFDITTMYFYGHDSAYLGSNTPYGGPSNPNHLLPAGAHAPSWNGALFESHYMFNPKIILINRFELVRMSQQAFSSNPGDLGNLNTLTFAARYYPFISSRAGFAVHGEYAINWQQGVSPVTFHELTSSSLLFGFDFAF